MMFAELGNDITTICEKYGFVSTTVGHEPEPYERHDTWDWQFSKSEKTLNRFISVALYDDPADVSDLRFTVEFWAGADNEEKFVRILVGKVNAFWSEIADKQQQKSHHVRDQILLKLLATIGAAEKFVVDDLVELYPSASKGSTIRFAT